MDHSGAETGCTAHSLNRRGGEHCVVHTKAINCTLATDGCDDCSPGCCGYVKEGQPATTIAHASLTGISVHGQLIGVITSKQQEAHNTNNSSTAPNIHPARSFWELHFATLPFCPGHVLLTVHTGQTSSNRLHAQVHWQAQQVGTAAVAAVSAALHSCFH